MASTITFSGLGSGIDMASIVTATIDTEKARYVTPIETWKQSWSDKVTAFQDLNTKLAAFQSTVVGLDTPSEFLVKTASSTNETALQATADDTAINSSYTVEVNQLAKAEKEIHAGHADKDTTPVTGDDGTFSYTYNG
ncbi:MAG: flagellar cap protein FliD N-terminal domain-containing protein, partial [Pseudomonadota bacterium]